ncbi:RAxF-45 family protein [Kroppenstedtia pulmonis]|uniref:RAxF-45 family protein n=1 Tax=Kroppenstedtia pulmonis TaxID=1380685 RepID=UPI0015657ECF|nr:RAxF-45 family protein [Kroppenstedtia pulmonis]
MTLGHDVALLLLLLVFVTIKKITVHNFWMKQVTGGEGKVQTGMMIQVAWFVVQIAAITHRFANNGTRVSIFSHLNISVNTSIP